MLKILIIDDDPLSRRGIRTLLPWSDHQAEVIGEASNGKEALTFLRTHSVDLVFVDLDMPVMNGMEFIRHASPLYPELNFVVLTVHTEFEYIQDVLRLGAIDYIVKNQFNQENFDQIINRIQAGIIRKNPLQKKLAAMRWKDSKILSPNIYALITIDTENEEHIFEFWEKNQLSVDRDIYEIIPGTWIFTDERKTFYFPDCFTNTMLLNITDVRDMTYSKLGGLLRSYVKNLFFYDYRPEKKINYKRAYELTECEYITDEDVLKKLEESWISLNWIRDNALFHQLKFDLVNCRLTPSRLYHLLLTLENVWNSSYSELVGTKLNSPPSFHSWTEVEEWLGQIYEMTNLFHISSRYSREVTQNILAAKAYIDAHYASHIEAPEVARLTHMSYGYFSRCFHDIIGLSFSDYCIQVRIRQAKKLLTGSTKTLQQIAADIGYNDEKYFSRIFKKTTGQTPSEYRKSIPQE